MNPSRVSVCISSFAPSASQEDVSKFVQPFDPIEIRLQRRNNDPLGERVAFVDFADAKTALSLIAKKNFSHFMGQSMRLRLSGADRNNNDINTPNPRNNRSFQETLNSPQVSSNQHRRTGFKERSGLRDIKSPRGIERGSFKIITSVSCTHFVALEMGWQKDMEDLTRGLEDFANFAKCGVDEMDSSKIYACKELSSGKWRRCRKIVEEGDALVVDLIDVGGPMVVTKDKVLFLSQLYKDWRIKSVDIFLDGYTAVVGSNEDFRKIEEHLLNKTFQLAYFVEKTGPLMRDRVRVQEMKLDGRSVLDDLVAKGLLVRQQATAESPASTPLRTMTKSFNTPPRAPRAQLNVENTPSEVEPPFDPTQPMEVDVNLSEGRAKCGRETPISNGTPTVGNAEFWLASSPEKAPAVATSPAISQSRTPVQSLKAIRIASPAVFAADHSLAFENAHTPRPKNCEDAFSAVDDQNSCIQERRQETLTQYPKTARIASPTVVVEDHSLALENAHPIKPKNCEDASSEVDDRDNFVQERRQETATPSMQKLVINEVTAARRSDNNGLCFETMSKLLGGRAAQQMISDRIGGISADLNKLKVLIAQLTLTPAQGEPALNELRHYRRTAQMCTQDLEEIIQLASPETLEAYHLSAWAQFVGDIWSPLMNLSFFNEQPLCVYKGSVIRRAEIDMSSSIEDDPRITVIIERAIDPSKMFKFTQDLMTHKNETKVDRVFFSEDNYKAFIVLASPASAECLGVYGRERMDYLLRSRMIE